MSNFKIDILSYEITKKKSWFDDFLKDKAVEGMLEDATLETWIKVINSLDSKIMSKSSKLRFKKRLIEVHKRH